MWDECGYQHSWECDCECDHWCWHSYEWECRRDGCECEAAHGAPDESDDGTPDSPFGLKDLVIVAGGAAAVFGAASLLDRGMGRSTNDRSNEESTEAAEGFRAESSQTSRELPTAGWYLPNASELLRWWDGSQWTDHYQKQSSTTAPPGWYVDGRGAFRWWDGYRWTHHTAPIT